MFTGGHCLSYLRLTHASAQGKRRDSLRAMIKAQEGALPSRSPRHRISGAGKRDLGAPNKIKLYDCIAHFISGDLALESLPLLRRPGGITANLTGTDRRPRHIRFQIHNRGG